jgi:flagellar basal-body rod protein FlgF
MNSIEVIEAAMTRDLKHLNNVSHNIANLNTPGYLAKQSFDQVLANGQTVFEEKATDRDGGVRDSTRALDLAVLGAGYFVVEKHGQQFLTRDGRFHLNPEGYLTHQTGALALGSRGPIKISGTDISVQGKGEVVSANALVDKLLIAQSSSPAVAGQGLLLSSNMQLVSDYQLKPFALNGANVDASHETIKMMELSRHMQSLQKAAAAYDQMMQTGINEIGKSK